jgi:hypothetical protein
LNVLLHYYSFEFVIMVQNKIIYLTIMQGLMQKQCVFIMLYVIFGLKFDIQFKKLCAKCSNKPIKICHVGNAILRKDFNLGTTSSFFHAFTPMSYVMYLFMNMYGVSHVHLNVWLHFLVYLLGSMNMWTRPLVGLHSQQQGFPSRPQHSSNSPSQSFNLGLNYNSFA